MDGESLSVAQKQRKSNINDNNFVGFTDHPDPVGESHEEKIQRGKAILRQQAKDDPDGNLGLNINMGGESFSIAQKGRTAIIDDQNYVVFTDHPDPAGETHEQKIQRGKAILRQQAREDPDGNLGLNIRMDGESFSVAQKE